MEKWFYFVFAMFSEIITKYENKLIIHLSKLARSSPVLRSLQSASSLCSFGRCVGTILSAQSVIKELGVLLTANTPKRKQNLGIANTVIVNHLKDVMVAAEIYVRIVIKYAKNANHLTVRNAVVVIHFTFVNVVYIPI